MANRVDELSIFAFGLISVARFVGLITARGGSKGLPGKNIANVGGQPLIAWTIKAALGSRYLKRTIVSTDSDEIADVAKQFGAEVPFMRPADLAQDSSPHSDVIRHAILWLEKDEGRMPDYIVLLQPTSPFRTALDIDEACAIAERDDADSVVGVSAQKSHPYWTKTMKANGLLSDFMQLPHHSEYWQRQKLPPAYVINGVIYVIRCSHFMREATYFTNKTFGYVVPPERSLDIDTAWDLKLADLLLNEIVLKGK
ncbi:MAG TPA: acylneuraminate cytidylyltransferase family protein [Xanthobacteraceae bacterium]|nr:acylneuraminate cytidylyltransferase family protein [Xanthobacteraceae bacterium]